MFGVVFACMVDVVGLVFAVVVVVGLLVYLVRGWVYVLMVGCGFDVVS